MDTSGIIIVNSILLAINILVKKAIVWIKNNAGKMDAPEGIVNEKATIERKLQYKS